MSRVFSPTTSLLASSAERPEPMSTKTFNRFRGFTLIELMVVLAIAALVAVYAAQKMREATEEQLAKASADNIKTLGLALETFISSNIAVLGAGVNPRDVTVLELQAANSCGAGQCLSTTFGASPWSGGYTMRIRRLTATAPFQFEALACTTNGWQIAGALRNDLVGRAAQLVGGAAGMTYDTTSGAVGRTWGPTPSTTVANYPFTNVAGKLCYFVSQTVNALDQLYLRTDGGNRMNAALQMNSNGIVGATTVDASGAVNVGSLTSTGPVTAAGNISTATGTVSGSNVTATNNVTAGGTVSGGTLTSTGDINLGPGRTLQSAGRIHIQAGEHLYLQPHTNASAGQTFVGGGSGAGNLNVIGTATAQNVTANNNVTATNDVVINTLTSRPTAPTVTSVKALLPRLVELQNHIITRHGQLVPVPACSAGGTAQAFILPHVATGTAANGWWGTDVRMGGPSGGNWNVIALDSAGGQIGVNSTMVPATNFGAIVRTFCAY